MTANSAAHSPYNATKHKLRPGTEGDLWDISAIVEHGDARGRTMGFPTANMHLEEGYPLAFGIYAVRVGVLDGRDVVSRHNGVANFGVRPMYRISRPLLEVHLFDFDGDLYGKTLGVRFAGFLRPEAAFSSLEALIGQIGEDARQARALLEVQADANTVTNLWRVP